ncbi:unnamed protein product [Lactuca virosa]|uniref:Uncharacterized protein n=1 Tax=Lactuca virosa TaxID=75947 RepID=A0AAU9P8P9_9ASTR|nr:unnamed protein product [Lactuca virosa]
MKIDSKSPIKSSTPKIIHDLKVVIHDTITIFPSHKTEKRSMFLSNIDQTLNFNIDIVHFFVMDTRYLKKIVVEKLKSTLSKALVAYDFLAGRLRFNLESQRFEIDCNGLGALFVVGSSEFELGEIGDLVYPNPGFRQLVQKSYDDMPIHDRPLCILQVSTAPSIFPSSSTFHNEVISHHYLRLRPTYHPAINFSNVKNSYETEFSTFGGQTPKRENFKKEEERDIPETEGKPSAKRNRYSYSRFRWDQRWRL